MSEAQRKFVCPEFPKEVNILGSKWSIRIQDFDQNPYFKKHEADGYSAFATREIVVCNPASHPEEDGDEKNTYYLNIIKNTMKHEIVHAFLSESGLDTCAFSSRRAWSKNEEMVDWIAIQGQKIYKAWKEAGCLDEE